MEAVYQERIAQRTALTQDRFKSGFIIVRPQGVEALGEDHAVGCFREPPVELLQTWQPTKRLLSRWRLLNSTF